MSKWAQLNTEQRNPASQRIDEVSTLELLGIINAEDRLVAPAVGRCLPAIAEAVEAVAAAFGRQDRLFYMGAGTSGRLGVLDASECPPTYGTDPRQVQGLIAGGSEAVFRAVEGAEDNAAGGAADLQAADLSAGDVVFGIAASGVTPYVIGGLDYARSRGCTTVFFTCSPAAAQRVDVDIRIVPEVGPEVITGSTRMKAGTATKLVLNMVTTAAMVLQGKTYGNLMVDLQPKNAKLRDRSVRILCELAAIDPSAAAARLAACDGELKVALVAELTGDSAAAARQRLARCQGRVKQAVAEAAND